MIKFNDNEEKKLREMNCITIPKFSSTKHYTNLIISKNLIFQDGLKTMKQKKTKMVGSN
jgi:hypothetical protein